MAASRFLFMNAIRPIVFMLLLLLPSALMASQWNRSNYNNITHKNFRTNPLFHARVDMNNIDYPLLNAAIFFLTNEQRAKKGLKVLEYNAALEAASYHHSVKMGEKKFFSHTNAKEKGRKTSDDRARLAGITNPHTAENIVFSTNKPETYLDVAEKLMDLWMKSPGHRQNILSKKALQLGCGAYYKNGWYATQNFQWFEKVKEGSAVDKVP